MKSALGMIEFSKIPTGFYYLDKISKGNNIEVLYSATVCPGKFIALIKGDISSISNAIDEVQGESDSLIDSFVLGNPSEGLINCILGISLSIDENRAIALSESFSVAAIIEAADIAIKTSGVKLCELRLAKGLCGKSLFVIEGDVGAVKIALNESNNFLKSKAMYIDSVLIPNPHKGILEHLI